MHSILAERRRGENETIHVSGPIERRWALINTWVFAAVICINSDAPLTASENIHSVCFDHRYPDHIWFIFTYERGLIWNWHCLHSHASFLLTRSFDNSSLCHVRRKKKRWVTGSIRYKCSLWNIIWSAVYFKWLGWRELLWTWYKILTRLVKKQRFVPLVDWPNILLLLFFLQPAHQVPSSPPRVQVCACSAHPTAAPHLRPPPSACAVTATTAATPTSRTSPAPVSWFPHASQHVPQSHSYSLFAVTWSGWC